MAFYAGRIVREPEMANPTVVVVTHRNDLDDQLFTKFSRCADLLRQLPVQAESRADLRAKLAVESGGVVFTTIQKFFPEEKGHRHPQLSNRRNIVVIADEAHRSQYDFIDGYARHMRDALPNASFIGVTGTPIELADAGTRAVFGDHISVYDIQRAVDDEATVPIYYESRLAELTLDKAERPQIDAGFEEVTEGEEADRREKLKTKWAQTPAGWSQSTSRRGASGPLPVFAERRAIFCRLGCRVNPGGRCPDVVIASGRGRRVRQSAPAPDRMPLPSLARVAPCCRSRAESVGARAGRWPDDGECIPVTAGRSVWASEASRQRLAASFLLVQSGRRIPLPRISHGVHCFRHLSHSFSSAGVIT